MKEEDKLQNPNLGIFIGAFASEGNLPENGTIKITNNNLNFLSMITSAAKEVFGNKVVTNLPPTPEHKDNDEGYHKYYTKIAKDFLINNLGVKPGRKVLNDDGIPIPIMNALENLDNNKWLVDWLKNFLRFRFSGDGHVRKYRKEIILTKNNALKNIGNEILSQIVVLFDPKKPVEDYPLDLVNLLKQKLKDPINYPKEFIDIEKVLKTIFNIDSYISAGWPSSIYFDRKRGKFIITGVFRLFIKGRKNLRKFYENINFAECDKVNINKLKYAITN